MGHKDRKPKTIVDVKTGYSPNVIRDPVEFYDTFKGDKTVKFKENAPPDLKDTMLVDVVLAGRGFEEDRIYEDFPFYRNNIRRGNTLIKLGKEIHWLRKGLRKFFDIRVEYLDGLQGNHSHEAIFREIDNVLSFADKVDQKDQPIVHVWKLLKANGQNCQISYSKELDCWSASSKNVSLVVKSSKDLQQYTDPRYKFATAIAQCFFRMVENNKYTPEQLHELKKYLSNRTIIGEYCGHPDHQHIVKYKEETILFYAVVDHSSVDTCIPPPEAGEFLKRFRLPATNELDNCLVGKYRKTKELYGALKELFYEIAESKLDSNEEGCVVYFGLELTEGFFQEARERKMQDHFWIPDKCEPVVVRVSSLGKMKTLEYRILRKMREKLRSCINPNKLKVDKASLKTVFGKIVKESKQLIGKSTPQTPFEYYLLIVLSSLNYISQYSDKPGAFKLLTDAYTDYLSVIMYSIEKNIHPTFEMMTDQDLVLKLRDQPWSSYNTNVSEQYNTTIEAFYPEFKKIIELGKKDREEGSSSQEDVDDDRV